MRMAVIVLALVVGSGCKDKQPAKRAPASEAAHVAQDPGKPPSLEVPQVSGPGLERVRELGPKVTVTKTAIEVDGESVVALDATGPLDRRRLDAMTRLLEKKATSDAPVAIALDATVTYQRLGELLDTLKRAGFRNLALLAGDGTQMIPIQLPDSTGSNGPGLRLVIALDRAQLRVWSVSGQEGTRRQPKLSMAAGEGASFALLTRALTEIVHRRWPDGKRPAEDRAVIVQLDGAQPAQRLLNLLAAVRSDGSLELFPDIVLAGGV